MTRKIVVLYISHAPNVLGGANRSLFNMIQALSDFVKPIILCPSQGVVSEFYQSRGIECIYANYHWNCGPELHKRRFLNPLFYKHLFSLYRHEYKTAKNISRLLKDKNIQIVHSNASVFNLGIILSKLLKCKHVWHIREFQDLDFGLKPYLGWWFQKRLIWHSDVVVAITKSIFDHYQLKHASQAYTIWNAVRSVKEGKINLDKEKYFLFCARMINEAKGLDICIEAFSKSKLSEKGYKLLVIGEIDPAYRDTIDVLKKNCDCLHSIEFIGLSYQIDNYMQKATAFIMSSRFEAMGRVTVEAMFNGCPVIGKNSGGTKELLDNNKYGYLFNTVDECAQIMVYITNNEQNSLIKRAYNFANDNFTIEQYSKKMLKIYQNLI